MIPFTRSYRLSNPQYITRKNIDRIVAISSVHCTHVIHRGIDPATYYEKWRIVKEKEGYIFREVTHGSGISGHHKTLRGLVLHSAGFSHIQILLLEKNESL